MRARLFWIAVSLGVLSPGAASGQDVAPHAAPSWLQGIRLQQQPSTPGPVFLGDYSGAVYLSLNDAVLLALARNPALAIERVRLEGARRRVGVERGQYDMLLNVGGFAGRRDNIIASRFYPTGLYLDSEHASHVSVESKIPLGGQFRVGVDYRRLESTSNTQTLSPQYSANLVFAFSQPLLRDFGLGTGTARIRVAAKQAEIAQHALFQQVTQLVERIEEEYWTFVFARQQLLAQQQSLEAAREFLLQTQTLLRAGRVATASVLEARAAVAEREESVLVVERETARVEDRLKGLLRIDLSATLAPADGLEPFLLMQGREPILRARQDEPVLRTGTLEPALLAEHTLEMALARRPEVRALEQEVEQREIELKLADNQTLPRLDATIQYTASGMAGRPNPTCIDPTSPLCLPVGDGVPNSIFAARTDAGDAFGTVFSRQPFAGWSAELRMQVPLRNRTAKAQQAEAILRLMEARLRLSAVRDQIEQEIRNAVRDASTARKRVDVARENLAFIETHLRDVRRRFEATLASSYDVLRAQDERDRAKTTELKALMDFNVALSKVGLADMSILERHEIELADQAQYRLVLQ